MKKVIIMGAGVGGMTAAHFLATSEYAEQFEVHVIERNSIVGGQARSAGKPDTGVGGRKDAPGEYCWRAYGPGYVHLRQVLKEIPVTDIENVDNVHDLLLDLNDFVYTRDDGEVLTINTASGSENKISAARQLLKRTSWTDAYKTLNAFALSAMSSDERNQSYDDITWKSMMDSLSDEMKKFAINPIGIYYGLDIDKTNAAAVLDTMGDIATFVAGNTFSFSVMTGPTNEMWLDRHKTYLESKGVKFHMEKTVTHVAYDSESNKIIDVVMDNSETIKEIDYVICSLPTESAAELLKDTPCATDLTKLAPLGKQIQTSIAYHLDDLVLFQNPSTVYMVDSPWVLMILPQGHLWKNVNMSDYGDGNIKDYWAVGIGNVNVPGLNGKTFLECTREEAIEEVWNQCLKSKALECGAWTESGKPLTEVKVLSTYIWDSFEPNSETGLMDTHEPKFSNNVGTFTTRPHTVSPIDNMLFATAYTHHSGHIFNMEGACEAAKRATNEIFQAENLSTTTIKKNKRHILNAVFCPFRQLDKVLFKLGVPHLSEYTGGALPLLGLSFGGLLWGISRLL